MIDQIKISDEARKIADRTQERYGTSTYARDEMEHLAQVALEVPRGGLIVEIGVYSGCTASILLHAAKLVGDVTVGLADTCRFMWDDNAKRYLEQTLEEFIDVSMLLCIPGDSKDLADRVRTMKRVNLLHIDGDHSEEGVKRDCDLWLGLVRKDGVVVFHDYKRGDVNDGRMCQFGGLVKVVDREAGGRGWEELWTGGGYGQTIRRKTKS